MSKKNVLFVAHHLTIGGVQKSLVSALNSVDYESNNVTLYLRKNRLDLLPFINKNVTLIVNKDSRHYYRLPYAIFLQIIIKLKTLLKKDTSSTDEALSKYIHDKQFVYEKKHYFFKDNYDIAIAYNEGYTAEFVMDCVTAKHKIMFFQSSVDSKHEIHKRIMPQFNVIVVEHSDIQQSLLSWYKKIKNKIRVLENYTDYKLVRELGKKEKIIKDSKSLIICTCARFSFEKGLDIAVEAAKLLKDRGIAFKWYLVGDGPEKTSIDQLVNMYQLQDFIILPGMQTNPYPYMAKCDIYVQPSRNEALSISMLESQMLCVPMVSTKTAGGSAMIKPGVNGLLADIGADSLAQTIEELKNNNDLQNSIKSYLYTIDYSKEEVRYRSGWKNYWSNNKYGI